MAILTYILLGWTVARTGLGRLSPQASWLAILGALSPELDALPGLVNPYLTARYFQGPLHSLLAAPFLAVLCAGTVRLISRQRLPWFKATEVAMAGVGAHLAVDAMNSFGIQWAWPIAKGWIHLDWISRSDPWPATILLVLLAVPALSKLVSSEIGAKSGSGRGAAIFALALVASYAGLRQQMHVRAEAMLESRLYDRIAPKRVAAIPDALNPFSWEGLVDNGRTIRSIPVPTLGEFDPDAGEIYYWPDNLKAWDAAKRGAQYQSFAPRLRWPIVEAVPDPEGWRVTTRDLALGIEIQTNLDPGGSIQTETVRYPK